MYWHGRVYQPARPLICFKYTGDIPLHRFITGALSTLKRVYILYSYLALVPACIWFHCSLGKIQQQQQQQPATATATTTTIATKLTYIRVLTDPWATYTASSGYHTMQPHRSLHPRGLRTKETRRGIPSRGFPSPIRHHTGMTAESWWEGRGGGGERSRGRQTFTMSMVLRACFAEDNFLSCGLGARGRFHKCYPH